MKAAYPTLWLLKYKSLPMESLMGPWFSRWLRSEGLNGAIIIRKTTLPKTFG